MTAAASLPAEAAQRSLVENALSPGTRQEHPELVERIVSHQKARPGDPAAWQALASGGATYSGGMRQSRILAPTLIVYGDADAVVDPRNSKLLAGRIPNSQLVAFPGLGHLFFWEEPTQFATTVTSFLLSRRINHRAAATMAVSQRKNLHQCRIPSLQERAAAATQIEWINALTTANADFMREMSAAYFESARGQWK